MPVHQLLYNTVSMTTEFPILCVKSGNEFSFSFFTWKKKKKKKIRLLVCYISRPKSCGKFTVTEYKDISKSIWVLHKEVGEKSWTSYTTFLPSSVGTERLVFCDNSSLICWFCMEVHFKDNSLLSVRETKEKDNSVVWPLFESKYEILSIEKSRDSFGSIEYAYALAQM